MQFYITSRLPRFKPSFERHFTFIGPPRRKETLDANIFVKVLPMDMAAFGFKVPIVPLTWRGM